MFKIETRINREHLVKAGLQATEKYSEEVLHHFHQCEGIYL